MQSTFTRSRSSSSSRSAGSKRASWSSAAAPRSHAATNALRADSDQPLAAVHQHRSPGRAPYQCSACTLWPCEVAVPVADRLGLARRARGEHDQRRAPRARTRSPAALVRRRALVRHGQDRPVEAGRGRRGRGRARRPRRRAARPSPCARAGRRAAAARCRAAPPRRAASRPASRRPTRAGCRPAVITTSPRPTPRAASAPASRAERSATSPKAISRRSPSRAIATSARRRRRPRRRRRRRRSSFSAASARRGSAARAPARRSPSAIATICSRGASGFDVHQFAIDCVPPTSISASSRRARRSSSLSSALAPGSCEMSTVTSAVTCSSIRLSNGRRLRVGHVAEQHAPRVAALLDECEERIQADGQPRGPGLDLHAHERRADALGELAGVARDQIGVELLLGGEMLVDEGLRDPGLACDVVDRGRVVAAL